jgi:trehalose utilization protein
MADAQNAAPVRVLVWDENPPHAPKELYPKSINGAIADGLNELGGGQIVATTANLDDPEQGITEEALANADVLLWWGHARHAEVSDETAARVKKAVHENGWAYAAALGPLLENLQASARSDRSPSRRLARDRRL